MAGTRADLGSAVRFLERRGMVSAAEAEVAQQAEPGLVAMLMSQRPRGCRGAGTQRGIERLAIRAAKTPAA